MLFFKVKKYFSPSNNEMEQKIAEYCIIATTSRERKENRDQPLQVKQKKKKKKNKICRLRVTKRRSSTAPYTRAPLRCQEKNEKKKITTLSRPFSYLRIATSCFIVFSLSTCSLLIFRSMLRPECITFFAASQNSRVSSSLKPPLPVFSGPARSLAS